MQLRGENQISDQVPRHKANSQQPATVIRKDEPAQDCVPGMKSDLSITYLKLLKNGPQDKQEKVSKINDGACNTE